MAEPIESLAPPMVPAAGGTRSCEYCRCKLTANGEVLEMSQRARELRTIEDRLTKEIETHGGTKAELVAAAQTIADLQAKLAAASTAPAAVITGESDPWGGR